MSAKPGAIRGGRALAAVVAICSVAACGAREAGEAVAEPGRAAGPAAGAPASAAGAKAAAAPLSGDAANLANRRAALAELYHVQRCVLTGSVLGQAGRFASAGVSNAAAFDAAFLAEAHEAPGWAAEVVASSYQRGCGADVQAAEGP